MSLRVWLPLNGDLRNQGISNSNNIISTGSSVVNTGKIGKCMKITSNTDLQYTPNFNQYGLSLSGWFKINQNEVATVVDALNYTSTAYAPTGNLFGNTNYGGIGLIWIGNNHYSSGTFSYITAYAALRTPSVNQITAGASIEFDTWIHLTLTWDPTTHILSLYKNGNLINSKTFTAFTDGVARTLYLNYKAVYGGNGPTANIPLYCNDIRVYDNCLSAAEVREISQGLVLHYKLDAATQSQTNLVPCGTTYTKTSPWTVTTKNIDGNKWVTNSAFEATPSTTYTISVECDGTLSTGHGPGGLSIDQKPWSFWLYICNVDTTKSWQNGSYDSPINLNKNNYNYRKIGNAHVWTYTLSNTQKYISLRTNCYSDGTNVITINWWNMKIEKGSIYTPWGNENYIIQDSSGYNHNGIITGDLMLVSDSQRYSTATKWNCSDPTTNNNTGLCYIQTPLTLTTPLQMSITWWAKPESGYGGSTSHAAFCTSNNTSAPTDYNTTAFHHRDSGFDIYPSDGSGVKRLSFTYTKNEWHHYAVTYDGTTARAYQDGVLKTSIEIGANKTLASFSQLYIGFSKAGGAWRKTLGSYSDFRVYVTQLLDTDIKQLYNVGMKVDKKANIHPFELEENIGMIPDVKFVNNSANSVSYDAATDTYTIVSRADTSSWGYGVRLADNPPLWVPYGATYRWTAEVWTPIALNVNTDYNNTTGSADTVWAGNDNDATGTRLAAGVSIPANTWTRIYRGASNTHANNTNHLPIRDYSSLGLVTSGQSEPVTWKVRHLQWYLVDTDFKPQLKKTGTFKSSHFTETEEDLNKPAQLNKKMFSTNATQFIER